MCHQPQRNPRAELKGHVYGAKCIDGQPELSDLMITDHKLELIHELVPRYVAPFLAPAEFHFGAADLGNGLLSPGG
jgi:hypothetical protein